MSTPSFLDRNNFGVRLLICLLFTGLIALLSWVARQPTSDEFYNAKARLLAQTGEPDDRVILLAVDDESVINMPHRWPWPRSVYGSASKYCEESSLMSFDMLYDLRSGLLNQDELFIEQMADYMTAKNGGAVVMGLMLKDGTEREAAPIAPRFALEGVSASQLQGEIEYEISMKPFDALLQEIDYLGHTTLPANRYGRYSMVANYSDNIYPSLAMASFMAYQGFDHDRVSLKQGTLTIGDAQIRLDAEGNVPYRHYRQPYKNCSFVDIYSAQAEEKAAFHNGVGGRARFFDVAAAFGAEAGARVGFSGYRNFDPNRIFVINREMFKDKLLIVGSTATGIQGDREPTPIGISTPGIFIHAAVMDNLLNGTRIWDWDWRWDLIMIFLLGLLPAFGDTPTRLLSGGLFTWLCYIGLTIIALLSLSWFLPWLWPTIALISSTVLLAAMSWSAERVQRRDLEEMEHAKQQFTDMLVHDLKGRVSSMVMSMSLIETELPDESRPRKLVNTMQSSGSRLLTQVNALLDIRKIEEGRMKLDRVPVNLNDVVREVLQDYQANASLIRLSIVEKFDTAFKRPVEIDPDIFRRILENLIWNALQYARKDTVVTVATESGDEHFSVSVSNHGKLIPEKTVKQLFKPFVSGKGEEKNVKSVSTGLGLAFCRLAAEAHQGQIDLHSPWPGHEDGVQVNMSLPYTVNDA